MFYLFGPSLFAARQQIFFFEKKLIFTCDTIEKILVLVKLSYRCMIVRNNFERIDQLPEPMMI